MQAITPIAPFSDLRNHSKKILSQLDNSPVVLTMRGRPMAVLIDYEEYNKLVKRQQELEAASKDAQPSRLSLRDAASLLLNDYQTDEDLTAFTALDGDDIYVAA